MKKFDKKCVIYIYSDSKKHDDSVRMMTDQSLLCRRKAYHTRRLIKNMFFNFNVSRTQIHKSKVFNNMLNFCVDNSIDCIIAASPDKIAKDVESYFLIINKLALFGIEVIYATL